MKIIFFMVFMLIGNIIMIHGSDLGLFSQKKSVPMFVAGDVKTVVPELVPLVESEQHVSDRLNRAARSGDRLKAEAILDNGGDISSRVLRRAILFGHLEYNCSAEIGSERDRMVVIDMIRFELMRRRAQ